jgi:hypothetical protein
VERVDDRQLRVLAHRDATKKNRPRCRGYAGKRPAASADRRSQGKRRSKPGGARPTGNPDQSALIRQKGPEALYFRALLMNDVIMPLCRCSRLLSSEAQMLKYNSQINLVTVQHFYLFDWPPPTCDALISPPNTGKQVEDRPKVRELLYCTQV